MFLKSKFLFRGASNQAGAAALVKNTFYKPNGISGAPLALTQQTSNLFTYPFYNKFGFATRRGSGPAPEVINEATIDDSIRVETAEDCKFLILHY